MEGKSSSPPLTLPHYDVAHPCI